MKRAPAPAKLNLALVVGPRRADGRHEVVTVLQRIDLSDQLALSEADELHVEGFSQDTLVRDALLGLARAAGVEARWEARIEKRIPVSAGLGGGSSDAATALRLANETLERPLGEEALAGLAASLGVDVAFFLRPGPQLGEGDGTTLSPLALPQDYAVVLLLPEGARKASTASVYKEFDRRGGGRGFEARVSALREALAGARVATDLAELPPNDLASSPLAAELRGVGAFRAEVSGAGPAVYGLFEDPDAAAEAAGFLRSRGQVWLTAPAWYV